VTSSENPVRRLVVKLSRPLRMLCGHVGIKQHEVDVVVVGFLVL